MITAGRTAWPITQSNPSRIDVEVATSSHPNTRTATRLTRLATPYCAPPMTPASSVPLPTQSSELACPSGMKFGP